MNRSLHRWRFAAGILGLLAGIGVTGFAFEVHHLGLTDADGRARVEDDVRSAFARIVTSLDATSDAAAGQPDLIRQASSDAAAARKLFGILAAANATDVSVTVYTAEGTPVAWVGRPSDSDLPRARVLGPAALLVAPGPSGPRLVRVRPVAERGPTGPRRVGSIVVERPLPSDPSARTTSGDSVVWPTSLVPVALRARYEGAGETRGPGAFVLPGLAGEPLLQGTVRFEDVAAARSTVRRRVAAAGLGLCALCCAWLAGPLLMWRAGATSIVAGFGYTLAVAAIILSARALAWVALPLAAVGTRLDAGVSPHWLRLALRSPTDLLLTALTALALAALAADGVTRLRRALRSRRRGVTTGASALVLFGASQAAACVAALAVLSGYQSLLRRLADVPAIDLVSFSLHPWNAGRLAVSVAILILHAVVVWAAVTVLRLGLAWFRGSRDPAVRLVWLASWLGPTALWMALFGALRLAGPGWVLVPSAALSAFLAWGFIRFGRWRRHASQAASLVTLFGALVLPAFAMYPAVFVQAVAAKAHLIETRLSPQVLRQRDDIQIRTRRALEQVDRLPALEELVAAATPAASGPPPTDAAFLIWSQTELGVYRLTSAVELYAGDGALVSRFALNLPEYTSTQQTWQEAGCGWDLFEEVSPFGSEERRLLHAGRGFCVDGPAGPRMVGAIVIHAMLDYGALPFITSQNPYVELFRNGRVPDIDTSHGRDLEFVVYGWSQRPIYTSAVSAWTLDASTFAKAYASRVPFWSRQTAAGRSFDVYVSNDRGGIYALGYPTASLVDHLVLLAELATLAGAVYALWLLVAGVSRAAGSFGGERGRALLREIRASFYRKLFLAFVAAAVIPVLTLAFVARAYMTTRLRADIEDAAIRTTIVAQRVVEDYGRLQERGESSAVTLNDDVMVFISRLIDQDVNVFEGPRLVATSERDLFASGLLPTRTSAEVYRAIVLDRRATFVGEERAGRFPYMVAAAPARVAGRQAILTVPLTLRQQAIEREIDDLNRRILLAVVAFVLIGSAIGYWMAERIADPLNRLQRATARIAHGDLDARVAQTSSDEFRRLVDAFNAMAAELKRQQGQLERTHRLEAWADMARQVAHEIKNPLTPIQLSAEHLRRVHEDRGAPLAPVLENCVESILGQVRLLRQIAAEFSSFGSSPTPRPVVTAPAELVGEVVEPYRAGLPGRLTLTVDVPAALPAFMVDRSLMGRALTNVIENALHSMPGGGSVEVRGRVSPDAQRIELAIADTGVGMDKEALSRIFEPYFSTKAIGTGLGLTIAKRNVELHDGTIGVESEPGRGTTVTISVPIGHGEGALRRSGPRSGRASASEAGPDRAHDA